MTGEAEGSPDTAGTDPLVAKFGEKRCDGNLRYRRRPDWYHNCDLPLGHDGMHLERCWCHDDKADMKIPVVTLWGAWLSADEPWPSEQDTAVAAVRAHQATADRQEDYCLGLEAGARIAANYESPPAGEIGGATLTPGNDHLVGAVIESAVETEAIHKAREPEGALATAEGTPIGSESTAGQRGNSGGTATVAAHTPMTYDDALGLHIDEIARLSNELTTARQQATAQALRDAADALPLPEDNWPEAPHNCRTHDLDVADWLRNRADTLDAAGEDDDLETVPRCQHTSPSPWGLTQCVLPDGHDGRHAYSPSETLARLSGDTEDGAP